MVMFNHTEYIKRFKEYIESAGLEFRLPLNEMFYTPKKTIYDLKPIKSERYINNLDYNIWFDTDKSLTETGHTYVLQFIYYEDVIGEIINKPLYNISFTTKEQYEKCIGLDSFEAEKIYEMPTNKNEREELIQRLIYLFKEFHKQYGNSCVAYVIGETNDKIKINYYRKLINDSLPNIKEIESDSSINKGKKVYYFKMIETV